MVLDFLDSDGNTLWRHQVKQKGYRVPLVWLLTKLSERLRYPFRVWLVIKEMPTKQTYPTTNTTFCSRCSMYGFRPEQLFNITHSPATWLQYKKQKPSHSAHYRTEPIISTMFMMFLEQNQSCLLLIPPGILWLLPCIALLLSTIDVFLNFPQCT